MEYRMGGCRGHGGVDEDGEREVGEEELREKGEI